ncbi:Immunoglobulin superfamily DCC subclass member 4 [Larimichthys crocea]|uniref:Uncharacterized protein n=1 Tax=Larimichthys crocea TaxID=215358 RepID=A0ACD3R2G1_LARCR|nr:Immunoglobulin superfamily DCC subclass member 4 [Larimichthys crocea]
MVGEKPVSVELSCGAGPSHVVLEPGLPLLLGCNLGASDTPFNVTWLQDGQPLPLEGVDFLQYLANGSLLLLPTTKDGQPPQGLEGGYSCVSASALGALTSRTVNVLLASLSKFHQEPSPQTVPAGGAARFDCQIEGVPTPVITWEKDKVAIIENTRQYRNPEQSCDCCTTSECNSRARPSRCDGVHGTRPAKATGVLEQTR